MAEEGWKCNGMQRKREWRDLGGCQWRINYDVCMPPVAGCAPSQLLRIVIGAGKI
jgi:hypothetical protein